MNRSALRRSTYRTLKPSEPDPEGTPLRYVTSDGRFILRWRLAPRTFVERVDRNPDGSPMRAYPTTRRFIDEARVRELYDSGKSTVEIARLLGFNTGTVSRALRRAGGRARPFGSGASPIDSELVVQQYLNGVGSANIAASLGISHRRIVDLLISKGVAVRPAGRVPGIKQKTQARTFQTEFEAMRPALRARSGGLCEARISPNCRGLAEVSHHRKMRSQGGTNDLANLLDSCRPCHGRIHHHPAESYANGLLVKRTDDPSAIPVRHPNVAHRLGLVVKSWEAARRLAE